MAKKQAVSQIGMNTKRNVYVIVADDNILGLVQSKIVEYGNNPSHRWIPLPLFLATGYLYITERQAKWLVDRMQLVHKIKPFALKEVSY